ncbi:MAG: hypothetical protein HY782_19480 [Chloroflexi bacterium]|nr:hypothetical protein [Chloroflexota bacterium]
MKRFVYLILLLSVISPALLTTACAANPASDVKMAPMNMLPTQMQNAPTQVREAYQFAVANPEATKNVPCYCGCGAIGHTSNYSCYVKEAKADGTVVFDDHALGCSLCVDITQDVMRLSREGRAPPDIRDFVVSTYSKFGPPNQ